MSKDNYSVVTSFAMTKAEKYSSQSSKISLKKYQDNVIMIDPFSGFIINIEQLDENQSSDRHPCIELIDTSDEDGSMTRRGAPKDTRRVWSKTDKQEWWKIYEDYMQDRLKRQPRPLDVRGCLGKDIIIGRDGFRSTGRTRRLRQGCPEEDKTETFDNDSKHVVKKSEHQRIKRELAGVPEYNSYKDLEQCFSEQTERDIDLDSLDFSRVENCNGIKVESVSSYDRIESGFGEMEENLSEPCPGKTSNADGAIYLELGLDEDTDPNSNNGNADNEEYEDIQYLNEEFINHGTIKTTFSKKNIVNLRQNSLKLLKHSNICPFKWTKHYFVCYVCREMFKTMHTLRVHMKDSHNYGEVKRKMAKEKDAFCKVDITELECTICSVIVKSLGELENHLTEHNVLLKSGGASLIPYKVCSDTLICQLCGAGFTTRFRLQRHMDGHFLNYVCPECDKGFHHLSSLKKHRRRHKDENSDTTLKFKPKKGRKASEARFKCSLCPQKFLYDYKRLQHMIEVHNKETKLFQCQFCPKIFMTLHWLTKHTICVHKDQL